MSMGIFCGTAAGTSMKVAKAIAKEFEIEDNDVINMEEDFDGTHQFEDFDVLFIGSSTWGQGDVHFSWVDVLLELEDEKPDFSGKTVAFFGAGDGVKHGEHFCSALGKLHQVFTHLGAHIVGWVDKEEYTYEHSLAEINGKLCGLAIDEHNEKAKTKERIKNWIEQLKEEIKE